MDFVSCAAITGICYFVGLIFKSLPFKDEIIPIACGVSGAILGIIAFEIGMADFPANDAITAVWIGISSGLAATGAHQAVKQFNKIKEI